MSVTGAKISSRGQQQLCGEVSVVSFSHCGTPEFFESQNLSTLVFRGTTHGGCPLFRPKEMYVKTLKHGEFTSNRKFC